MKRMCHFFEISNVSSVGRLIPDIMVPYAAMPMSHLLPVQVFSLFLCWYLFTSRGSQVSWFPLCLHKCLADFVRCQNSKFHLEVL